MQCINLTQDKISIELRNLIACLPKAIEVQLKERPRRKRPPQLWS